MARDPVSAIAWARSQLGSAAWRGRCEAFTRTALGFDSVFPSANAAWEAAGDKHPGDFNAPAGVPVFWALTGPNEPYGHVALSIGGGLAISSSDEVGRPVVSIISISRFTDASARYRGWAGFYHGEALAYTRGKHAAASTGTGGEEEMTPEQEQKLNRVVEQSDASLKALGSTAERVWALEQKLNNALQKLDHALTVLGWINERAYGANEHSRDAVQALNQMNTTER